VTVVSVILPMLVIGFAAGALRAAGLRATEPRTKKLLAFAWIALLLVGAPLWLFFAAAIGLR
jgi:hypothetical protein